MPTAVPSRAHAEIGPTSTRAELYRQADLYQRLAAAMLDRVKAQTLAELARKYQAMANATQDDPTS